MRRRSALALCALAVLTLLAGCSTAGSLHVEPVTDEELAREASQSLEPQPVQSVVSERPPWVVATDAIENGSTTVTAINPPIDAGLPVATEGGYYDLSWQILDERPANVATIGIDYNATDATGTAIAYGELPRPDREALAGLFPQRAPPSQGTDYHLGAIYTEDELNASALVPDGRYEVVVYEGQRYPITVDDPQAVTVHTFRYDATRVAANATAYADVARARYGFTLSPGTDGQRAVIEKAIRNGTYYAASTDDTAFAAVLERLRAREAIAESSVRGTWLVRYRGEEYLLEAFWRGFLGE